MRRTHTYTRMPSSSVIPSTSFVDHKVLEGSWNHNAALKTKPRLSAANNRSVVFLWQMEVQLVIEFEDPKVF